MKNLNVLVVEDESIIGFHITKKLEEFGVNVVDFVGSHDEVYTVLANHPQINLLIMDINLNDTANGIDIVNSLSKDINVIYITAYSNKETILKAAKTTPIGYLTKPINYEELNALLTILSQKLYDELEKNKIVDLGHGYEFNMSEEILSHYDKCINISGKKLELLKILIQFRGTYVSFEKLENILYPDEKPSESILRTIIYRLRSVFDVDIIQSERNMGVKLI